MFGKLKFLSNKVWAWTNSVSRYSTETCVSKRLEINWEVLYVVQLDSPALLDPLLYDEEHSLFRGCRGLFGWHTSCRWRWSRILPGIRYGCWGGARTYRSHRSALITNLLSEKQRKRYHWQIKWQIFHSCGKSRISTGHGLVVLLGKNEIFLICLSLYFSVTACC